jgi:hypothetical protein
MPYCGHCAKEIEKVDEEPDIEFIGPGDETVDHGMVDIYNHVHSGQHLCDRGGTGAIPVEYLHGPFIDSNNSKEMIAWRAMRKQVEADEAAEKKLEEQAEHEDMKEYEYLR